MKREELTTRIKGLYEKYHDELAHFQEALAPHYPVFRTSLMRRYKAAKIQRLEGAVEGGNRLRIARGEVPFTDEEKEAYNKYWAPASHEDIGLFWNQAYTNKNK